MQEAIYLDLKVGKEELVSAVGEFKTRVKRVAKEIVEHLERMHRFIAVQDVSCIQRDELTILAACIQYVATRAYDRLG